MSDTRGNERLLIEVKRLEQELHQAKAEWFEEKKRAREAEAERDRYEKKWHDADEQWALASKEVDRLREALERIAGNQIEWEEDEAGEIMAFARRALEGTSE